MAVPRFYGWTVVAAAFVVAMFGWGVGFYGPPIYLSVVRAAHGWSVPLVSLAMTVHFLVGAVVVANLPRLHRCFGVPAVTCGGAVSMAVGIVCASCVTAPWQLFPSAILTGAGWVPLGAAGINAMVSPWFHRRRPAALSMAFNGASIGGAVFSPLWVALIQWCGFTLAALLISGALLVAIFAVGCRVLGQSPDSRGEFPDGEAADHPDSVVGRAEPRAPLRSLWGDRGFQTLALGMALGLFAQIGLIAQLFSLLVPPLGAQGAGILAGMFTAAAVGGRSLVGWLLPTGGPRRLVGALNYVVQCAGCVVLILADGTVVPLLIVGAMLFGLGIGNTTSIPPLIAQSEFARADVHRVVALITAMSQGFYAFAPAAFGLIRGWSDSGHPGAAPWLFGVAACLQLAAALAYRLGHDRWRGAGA